MITDTHAYLSRWPFRRLSGDEPAEFLASMRKNQITQSWVGSFDGLLHKDISAVNARLAAGCRAPGRSGVLVPFGTVNPVLPDWQEDLRRCREQHRMPGIRLHPNYHGYTLTDPRFAELLRLATQSRLIVQLVVAMEDERTQHPMLQVRPVDLSPLAGIVRTTPGLRLVVHNQKQDPTVQKIAAAGQVYFDFAMAERLRGVATLANLISPQRVVFGSHFPLFYLESSILKMREAGLETKVAQSISQANAAKLLVQP